MNTPSLTKEALANIIEKAKYLSSEEHQKQRIKLMWRIMRWELLPKQIELEKKPYEHPFSKYK